MLISAILRENKSYFLTIKARKCVHCELNNIRQTIVGCQRIIFLCWSLRCVPSYVELLLVQVSPPVRALRRRRCRPAHRRWCWRVGHADPVASSRSASRRGSMDSASPSLHATTPLGDMHQFTSRASCHRWHKVHFTLQSWCFSLCHLYMYYSIKCSESYFY
jgi:hypothetical protein